eukprot:CAMPEP_0182588216 /NCGR_PEP_ID=MMETSP1324-20130603/66693_1 /TAXON_ID=236786 /ORGANISM="Florenciella sp., Strain RCC1587" /LENGTH=66 /DNA_ID=CAMNT_0024805267 /DNA_START=1 /DNA_END=198 /DNA_ORIENTATION=-
MSPALQISKQLSSLDPYGDELRPTSEGVTAAKANTSHQSMIAAALQKLETDLTVQTALLNDKLELS